MKKGMIAVFAMVMLSMTVAGFAAEGNVGKAGGDLGIDVDATWVSKYIWRGMDLYGDKAAFQPSINFDLWGSGFSFNVWASYPGASGHVNATEMDYTLTYSDSVFDGETYKTDYAVSWVYYDYPETTSSAADAQEFNIALEWPDLCPAGVVPHYFYGYLWTARGGGTYAATEPEGSVHVFGLTYDFEVPSVDLPFTFSADIVYNDGMGGNTIEHDWSHAVWGLSTTVDCPAGGTITPAIYYQTSMEDSVNKNDEFWTGISYSYSF